MSKAIKHVVIEFHFEADTAEAPHIKDWWLRNQVEQIVADNLKHMNSCINDVNIVCKEVSLLPEEITVKLADVL